MPDPFPNHHASDSLEASTTITTVTPEDMDHAAREAARLAEEAASAATTVSGRRRPPRKAAPEATSPTARVQPTSQRAPADPAPDPIATDYSTDMAEVGPEAGAISPYPAPDLAAANEPAPVGGVAELTTAPAIAEPGQEAENGSRRDPAPGAEALPSFGGKLVEAIRTNIESSMSFWLSMMQVKSVSEAVALNAQHLRSQIEAAVKQSRDLSSLAQQAVKDSLKSFDTSSRH